MTSFIRSVARTSAVFVLSASLATGVIGITSSAQAATDPAAEAPSGAAAPSSTAAPSAAAAPSSAAAAPSSTAAAPSTTAAAPSPSATPVATGSATAAKSAPAATPADVDPSLDVQDDSGNHAMGSSIPSTDPAFTSAPKVRSLLKAQSLATTSAITGKASGIRGLDVSAYQKQIDWRSVYANSGRFVYIKATEGTTYKSSTFLSQYKGSYAAGLIRGAYHYATPNTSSGSTQAKFFVANGGGWTADGKTLPPLLDIEYGYSSTCWGLSPDAMVKWISDFSTTVLTLTGTRPAIYTTTNWWKTCTANSSAFTSNPLMVAYYSTSSASPASLGSSWSKHTIWQWWHAGGVFPGDQDVFNGTGAQLSIFARGGGLPLSYKGPNAGAVALAPKVMTANKYIRSSNLQYKLTMKSDGNLVLRGNGQVLWQSKTQGNPGARAVVQTDGNFVVYSTTDKVLWQSGTARTGTGARVALLSNGDLQVKTSGVVRWSTGISGRASLAAGYKLTSNQVLHDSSGRLQAVMRSDGNFAVYFAGKAAWSTKTSGHRGAYLYVQPDGNLVLWSRSHTVLWQSKTAKTGSANRLGIQSNGDLVLRNAAGKALWHSKTGI